MKKFLKISLVFMFVSLAGYFILVYAVRSVFPKNYTYIVNVPYVPSGYGHLKTRIDDIKNYTDVDVLVIGSSHAYRGFDPRIFENEGLSMFNLGSSAQSHIQSHYFLKEYVNQLNPSLVIIEVFPETFASDGIESAIDLISNCPYSMQLSQMAFTFKNVKPFNTLMFRLADQGILNHNYKENNTVGLDQYVSGGYVEREMGNSKSYIIPDSFDLHLNEKQLKAFEKSINLLKENNIPVVLIQSPVTKKLYNSFREKDSFDKLMNSYGKYYNFNEIESLQDSILFYDADHLNQHGVEKFNKMLLDALMSEMP